MRLIWSTVILLLITGCAPANDTHPVQRTVTGSAGAEAAVVQALRDAGFDVRSAGQNAPSFFSAGDHVYTIEGAGELHLYEFRSESDAAAAAATVTPNGTGVGTSMPMWIAPPHWYRSGPTIVLYLGSSTEVQRVLKQEVGPPFAGS